MPCLHIKSPQGPVLVLCIAECAAQSVLGLLRPASAMCTAISFFTVCPCTLVWQGASKPPTAFSSWSKISVCGRP